MAQLVELCFLHQRSAVRIKSSAKFILNFYYQLYWKDVKRKEKKRPKKTPFTFLPSLDLCSEESCRRWSTEPEVAALTTTTPTRTTSSSRRSTSSRESFRNGCRFVRADTRRWSCQAVAGKAPGGRKLVPNRFWSCTGAPCIGRRSCRRWQIGSAARWRCWWRPWSWNMVTFLNVPKPGLFLLIFVLFKRKFYIKPVGFCGIRTNRISNVKFDRIILLLFINSLRRKFLGDNLVVMKGEIFNLDFLQNSFYKINYRSYTQISSIKLC